MIIECGKINEEADKLRNLLKKCYSLKASDLRVMVDLIQSVYECALSQQINQNNFVRKLEINEINLPIGYDEQDICYYILNLPEEERTILETDSKWNIVVGRSSS